MILLNKLLITNFNQMPSIIKLLKYLYPFKFLIKCWNRSYFLVIHFQDEYNDELRDV